GHSPTIKATPSGTGATVTAHAAPPLVRLADHLRGAALPAGNATLVIRRQTYPSAAPITGTDLYLDNGRYFYAPTRAGLPAAIRADEDNGASAARDIVAATQAFQGSIDEARDRMAIATLPPGAKPASANSVAGAEAQRQLRAKRAAAAGMPKYPPATPQ